MRLIELVQQGGFIMYLLVIINILGLALMLSKWIVFRNEKRRTRDVAVVISSEIKKMTFPDSTSRMEFCRQKVREYMTQIEKGLGWVKIIAHIAPLLGLLGTVVGVLMSFQTMAVMGQANPENFAGGISMALITTVGGLVVAIPHYIGHSLLVEMAENMEENCEQAVSREVLQ